MCQTANVRRRACRRKGQSTTRISRRQTALAYHQSRTRLIFKLSKIGCRSRYAQTANFGWFFVSHKQLELLSARLLAQYLPFSDFNSTVSASFKSLGQAHSLPVMTCRWVMPGRYSITIKLHYHHNKLPMHQYN